MLMYSCDRHCRPRESARACIAGRPSLCDRPVFASAHSGHQVPSWEWETAARAAGRSAEDIAGLLFVAAALLQTGEGLGPMETCVDAHRKLGCSHGELAFVLGRSSQRIAMLQMGKPH